jgi:splicing factor 3B subunit 3
MCIDEVESLMLVTEMCFANLFDEETPYVFTDCGHDPFSMLLILRHGRANSEMDRSILPAKPIDVWTVKKNISDLFDGYNIVFCADVTLVLSIGEPIEEVGDSQ